jgi:hypothetical protein
MPICNSKPEPREGKTLADFANRPELLQDDAGRIYDVNGNNVGYWSADEVEPEEEDGEDEDDDEEEE